ncbi:MAG: DsrE family protein [Candidatus Riflebacteria bacterium]|nr:DsrE family protein [Candidatus Riflebacteria bacterium]
MSILFIFNRAPYDGTDITWNSLRLAKTLVKNGEHVRIFLMNDSVDLARESCNPPAGYDQDLKAMLKELIAAKVEVEVCGTCMARCGIHKNEPYYAGANSSTMNKLAEWVSNSEKILTI